MNRRDQVIIFSLTIEIKQLNMYFKMKGVHDDNT